MKQTSVRTLLLLVGLFAAVVVHQSAAFTPAAQAATVWLDDDPNAVEDPNEPAEPLPENLGPMTWLDDDPNAVEDPNEPAEPLPESVAPLVWLDDDPNDPNEPLPETVAGMPFRSL